MYKNKNKKKIKNRFYLVLKSSVHMHMGVSRFGIRPVYPRTVLTDRLCSLLTNQPTSPERTIFEGRADWPRRGAGGRGRVERR